MTLNYWEKVTLLFEECSDYPPERWDNIIRSNGETDQGVLTEVRKLLSNRKKAEIFFESLSHRIENEISSPAFTFNYGSGDKIGRFIINHKIGHGGMADVYLAEREPNVPVDTPFIRNQHVAIKVMSCRAGNSWKSFRNEQKLLSGLDHPSIAEMLDYGITPEGLPYIVTEYIDGMAVDCHCDRHNLSAGHRMSLIAQVCDAIQYSHEKNVIHQDIKPANILVDNKHRVKVIDFGVSAGSDHERPSGFKGTISYASPEQLGGRPPSCSMDIFQIGMVLYRLIAGSLPADRHVPVPLPEHFRNNGKVLPLPVRRDMEQVLAGSLAVEPSARFPSAYELKTAILKLLDRYPCLQ